MGREYRASSTDSGNPEHFLGRMTIRILLLSDRPRTGSHLFRTEGSSPEQLLRSQFVEQGFVVL
ncbi:MAG: hypothetical protein ACI91J_003592 [Yoonia sp.]|jgi:hypothetical protein